MSTFNRKFDSKIHLKKNKLFKMKITILKIKTKELCIKIEILNIVKNSPAHFSNL